MTSSAALLRIADFRALLSTRFFFVMALNAQAVIVGWQVYQLTGSVLLLGLTGLAEALPALFCALFAGYIVDTRRPERVYRFFLGVLLLNMLVLLFVGGGFSGLKDAGILVIIFVGIVISGLARSFLMPAAFSLLPLIIRREAMPAAASLQTMVFQTGAIAGPTTAGLVFGGYGAAGAWIFATGMMLLAVVFSSRLKIKTTRSASIRPPASQAMIEGWRFLLANRTLLSVMSLDMLAVLFGGAIAVLPAFADQVLHLGSEGLGILRAAPAVGAFLGALYYAAVPMKRITALRLLIVVCVFGMSMIGFGLSTSLPAAFFFLALSGISDSVSMVIRGTLMQWLTPEAMRGRVSAVNSMFIISSNEIGAFQSGLFATLFGLVPSIVIGGFGTLLIVAAVAFFSPGFRRLKVEA